MLTKHMDSVTKNNSDHYTIEELSQILQVSQKFIRRKIADGSLEFKKDNGKYEIIKKDINHIERTLFKDEKLEIDLFGNKRLIPETNINKNQNIKKVDDVKYVDISKEWQNPENSNLTAVDLFSGAGGITKGFEMAGINCICGLDWFEAASLTYGQNFKHKFINGDIRDNAIKAAFYKTVNEDLRGRQLNIIAGGFPCQGFSMSGHRIISDERNQLYREMMEIINHLKPEFVIMENVVGLRTMLKGKIEEKIIDDLNNSGYKVRVTTLCAADYYVPQKRNRVIFVANRMGLNNYHPLPLLEPSNYITTKQAIGDLMKNKDDYEFNHVPTKHNDDMKKRLMNVKEGQSLYENYSDAWKKCPWEEASCTIKENHGGVNIHPRLPRVLTAREMARIQSFPDDFRFKGSKSQQLVQIGNAVPPLLAKAIGLAVVKAYEGKN